MLTQVFKERGIVLFFLCDESNTFYVESNLLSLLDKFVGIYSKSPKFYQKHSTKFYQKYSKESLYDIF